MAITGSRDYRRTCLAAAGYVAVAVAIVTSIVLTSTVRYAVNDDAWLQGVLNGRLTGTPDVFTGITSVFFNYPIVVLNRILGGVPWYPIIVTGGWAVCFAFVIRTIWPLRVPSSVRVLAIGLIVVATLPCVISPSYSSLAFGLGATALLFGAFGSDQWSTKAAGITMCVLLVTCSVVRWHAFLTMLAFCAPLVLFLIWTYRKRALTFLVIALVAAFGLRTADLAIGRSGEWREFSEFNTIRGLLHGTQRLNVDSGSMEPALQSAGWSQNDLALFARFVYPDPDVFTTDSLVALDNSLPSAPLPDRSEIRRSVPDWLTSVKNNFGPELLVVVSLALSLILVSIVVPSSRRKDLLVLALGSIAGAVVVGAAFRTLYRITVPMTAPLFFVLAAQLAISICIVLQDLEVADRKRGREKALVLLAIGLLGIGVKAAADAHSIQNRANLARVTDVELQTSWMDRVPEGSRFILVGAEFRFQGLSPWSDLRELDRYSFVATGWSTFSPTDVAMQKRSGFAPNYFDEALRPEVFVVMNPSEVVYLQNYYPDHRAIDVELLTQAPGLFRILPRSQ